MTRRSTSVLRLLRTYVTGALVLLLVSQIAGAQQTVTFEQMVSDLRSEDPAVRLKAVRALEQAGYEEAAVPLSAVIADPQGAIRLEAIRAELNLFLVNKIVPRKRVGLVVEVRSAVSAESAFAAGSDALEPIEVPGEVLTAMRAAIHDANPQIALEALYAYGTLAVTANGAARQAVLAASAPDLAGLLGVDSAEMRGASLRVIRRLYDWRPGDPPAEQSLGDALVTSVNERQSGLRIAAMEALGAMRYERAVQALIDEYTHYERGPQAAAALGALARIAHASTQPMFVVGLASRDSEVKAAAIEGLARLGDASQAPAIATAVGTDRSDAVLLAGQYATVRLSSGPIDLLVDALVRPRSHDTALRYLVETAPGRAASLGAYAQSQDPRLRAGIADVLGLSGDPQMLNLVRPLQQDVDPAVQRAAVRALARLGVSSRRVP